MAEWVERTNGEGALNARTYGQRLYSLDAEGSLIGRVANTDAGEWLGDDAVPETLLPLLEVFFDEMWPVLADATATLHAYIASDAHPTGGELPGKTFTATPGFEALQTGEGALTHAFEIGGIRSRRMVVPYQIWMLQRLAAALERSVVSSAGRDAVGSMLAGFPRGSELEEVDRMLDGCRVRKEGALLFSCRGLSSKIHAHDAAHGPLGVGSAGPVA